MSAGHTPGPWSVDECGDIVSGPYNVSILYATKVADKILMAAAPDMAAVLADAWPHVTDAETRGRIAAVLRQAGVNP